LTFCAEKVLFMQHHQDKRVETATLHLDALDFHQGIWCDTPQGTAVSNISER
jgi:hypothetical protein